MIPPRQTFSVCISSVKYITGPSPCPVFNLPLLPIFRGGEFPVGRWRFVGEGGIFSRTTSDMDADICQTAMPCRRVRSVVGPSGVPAIVGTVMFGPITQLRHAGGPRWRCYQAIRRGLRSIGALCSLMESRLGAWEKSAVFGVQHLLRSPCHFLTQCPHIFLLCLICPGQVSDLCADFPSRQIIFVIANHLID